MRGGSDGLEGGSIAISVPPDLLGSSGEDIPVPPDEYAGVFDFSGDEGDGSGGGGAVLRPDGGGGYRMDRETFAARVDRDGRVTFTDKPNIQSDGPTAGGFGALGWAGRFDVTDAIMRARGEDPYRYEKAKFLDETREMRCAMAAVERSDNLREAVHALSSFLDKIWSHDAWSPAERRRVIFELWDDCAEEGDVEMLAAAAQARASIVGFIRRRLPEGSTAGYGLDELARLNRGRRSQQVFDPYAAPTAP
jgi:hypothetical protein